MDTYLPRPTRPSVTVVVPLSGDRAAAHRSLESVALQTVPEVEVVAVVPGEDQAVLAAVAQVGERHPGLRLRSIRTSVPGVARAWNLGLAAATGQHVTFLETDAWLTPGYLAALLDAAEPGVVPVAHLAGVPAGVPGADGAGAPELPDHDQAANRFLRSTDPRDFAADAWVETLAAVAGKLLQTAHARTAVFDETLSGRWGEVYWCRAMDAVGFRLRAVPVDAEAVHHRSQAPGPADDRCTDLTDARLRLEVLARLRALDLGREEAQHLRSALVESTTRRLSAYLVDRPEHRSELLEEVDRRGLGEVVSLRDLQADMAHDLAILYAFAPYADTSATVAARRIRARGLMVDVVSNSLDDLRSVDPSVSTIVDPFVGRHVQVQQEATAFSWRLVNKFCRQGVAVVDAWVREKGPYRSVYSRAMFPASHLLAALVKLRWPTTTWLAEFSDSMMWDSNGRRRRQRVRGGPVAAELLAALAERGVEVPDDLDVPYLVELVAYVFADEVLFTNDHQLELMLGQFPDAEVARQARDRSVVEHHPTLPAEFYDKVATSVERIEGRVNVAYFGAFYLTRGLTEVVDALASLDADERSRVVLRVFTSKPEELAEEVAARGLEDVVEANPYVPYLEFLNLTTRMDVLIVNDARTRPHHPVNPYLPSKWSDYRGSGTDIWAVVEEGSVLAGMETAYRSELGDVPGAAEQLRRMIRDHGSAPLKRPASPARER